VAFEQNPALNRLINPMQQNQFPTGGMGVMSPISQPFNQQNNNQGWGDWLASLFQSTPAQQVTSSPYNQQQQQFFNNLLQQSNQNMQNPYAGFEPIQNDIMSQFYNEILPGIASRFTGMTGGALSSPSFVQQLGSGAQGLAERLALHKTNFGQQNRQFGLQQGQLGLTPQLQHTNMQRQPSAFENSLGLIPSALRAAGAFAGGF
jgi:hypothetical protein